MSTDRELLELAAKAAGIQGRFIERMPEDGAPTYSCGIGNAAHITPLWNPLTDDGDNLRLEVALRLNITYFDDHVVVSKADGPFAREYFFDRNSDPCSAKRYATVRVAAEIGKHSTPSKEES